MFLVFPFQFFSTQDYLKHTLQNRYRSSFYFIFTNNVCNGNGDLRFLRHILHMFLFVVNLSLFLPCVAPQYVLFYIYFYCFGCLHI